MVDQPNKDIPVYIVKREHGRGKRRMLHRNLLLPFMALPASKPNLLGTSLPAGSTQPLPVVTTDTVDSADQVDLAGTSSNDEVSSPKSEDAGTQSVSQPNKYVIPPKRRGYQGSTFNPLATPFTQRSQWPLRTRPARIRWKPRWQINGDYIKVYPVFYHSLVSFQCCLF